MFTDVTEASGVGTPIASQSAAWGDYDNDGDVDLYVAGEYLPYRPDVGVPGATLPDPDPRNLCRLYRNNGDGTFTDVAEAAGVLNERRAKGAAWGDYDDDGRPDLYVSNSGQANRLYHNNGDGTFTDVAPRAGRDRADRQLLLLVLGLRQRRPAGHLRHRLSRDALRGRSAANSANRPAASGPGSTTTRARPVSAT